MALQRRHTNPRITSFFTKEDLGSNWISSREQHQSPEFEALQCSNYARFGREKNCFGRLRPRFTVIPLLLCGYFNFSSDNNLKKNEMMLCPGFTSPEQFISSTISQTSDLYPIARLILFCLLDNHLFWFLCSRPNTREVLQDHIDGLEQLPELMFCVKQNLSMSSDFRQNSVQQLKSKLPSMLGELKHASPRLKELFNFRNDFQKWKKDWMFKSVF